MKKMHLLNSKKGETLIESLCAIVIIVLMMNVIAVAVTSAFNMQKAYKENKMTCQMLMNTTPIIIEVKIGEENPDGTFVETGAFDDIEGYEEDGFYYYGY